MTASDEKIRMKVRELKYPLEEMGVYIQPIEYGRACHMEYNFFYDKDNATELNNVKNLYEELSELIYSLGGVFSRPYGKWGEFLVQRTSVYRETMRKVKEIFDPNDILNPGKLF